MFRPLKKTLDRVFSRGGTPLRDDYILENGELMRVGYVNFDDKIQADKDDSLVYSILEKYLRNGDSSVLNRVHGAFFDATGLPHSLREAQDLGIRADRLWESVDPKIRKHFDMDKSKFMQEVAFNGLKFMQQFAPLSVDQSSKTQVTESEVLK